MTHQNLILTEEAIKGHCKRLKKKLQLLGQDISLTQTQNLFAQSLGFNNWNHLYSILLQQKSNNNLDKIEIQKEIKSIAIISASDLIRKSIHSFLYSQEIYDVTIFNSPEEYKNDNFDLIITDIIIINNNCPIIYLVDEKKEEVLYRLYSKLFYQNKLERVIKELIIYINKNQGLVETKYWNLLLMCCKKNNNKIKFERIALSYFHTFNTLLNFDDFYFVPQDWPYYFLAKPLSKDGLLNIISYIEH